MIQVTQSPFMQALGFAIINSLWQFALLWLVYFLINTAFKLSSHKKYSASLLLQITGFIWFAFTLVFYYHQCLNESTIVNEYANQAAISTINVTAGSTKATLFAWIIKTEQFLPYLSIAYLLLLVFLSFKWLHCYQFTQQIRQNGISKINVEWRLFVQRLSEQLGITANVKIFLSNKVKAPLTIGFLKPVILIPLASINHLNSEQMEAVILHELAHIKRLDYLINLLLSLIEATLFFNPFMQLLSRHIKRERENSCDDWVLQYEYNAATYAKALLKIATLQSAKPSFAMNAAENKDALLKRVKRMIEKSEKSFDYRHQLIALLFITIILSTISWLSPHHNKVAISRINKLTPVKAEPLAAKVDNPLFNPVFFLADDNNKEMKQEIEKEVKHVEKHMQKLSSANRLPLAIPEKNRKLALEEIPAPIIKNPSPIAKNKMAISPRIAFNIDTLKFKGNIKKLFTTRWMADLEKAEKDIRKNLVIAFEKNGQLKQPQDKEKVMHDLQVALALLKTTKLKLQKNIPLPGKIDGKYNNSNSQALALMEAQRWYQEEDFKTQAEEMRKAWQQVQQQYTYLAMINENLHFNIQLPAVVYTAPDTHSFSFEFTEKPRVKGSVSPATLNSTKGKASQSVQQEDNIEDEIISTYPSAPEQPAKKTINRTKRITIIHI